MMKGAELQNPESALAQRADRNQVVDSFRGLASLSVVLSHTYCLVLTAGFPSADRLNSYIGPSMEYLFLGSSVYFMVITGFILATKLPEWQKSKQGLLIKALQRVTKILVVYWAAVGIYILLNFLKQSITGTPWIPFHWESVISQLFLIPNFRTTPIYVAPAWYLQADMIIFLLVVAIYMMWEEMPAYWRGKLRPLVFVCMVPLLALCLYVENLGLSSELPFSAVRLLLYFFLGFLAVQAQRSKSALLVFALLVLTMFICSDQAWLNNRFYTNAAISLAFFILLSHYSTSLQNLLKHPIMKKLYQWNFSIFLLHWIILLIATSVARHLVPNSVAGLMVVIVCALATLFVAAMLFEKYIQKSVLRWHDAVSAYCLQAPKASSAGDKPLASMIVQGH
mgnify:CR=1 FL=1